MAFRPTILGLCIVFLAACNSGGLNDSPDGVFAPGIAGQGDIDHLLVGHRLMDAGEYELALKSYNRALIRDGVTVDTLSALGTANLNLRRLGQAERWLRRAVEEDPTFPPAWNNLGVVLMDRGQVAEASRVFQRAFAADNGDSDEIRENLRLALAKLENPSDTDVEENQNFNLIRRGMGDFLLVSDP